MEKFKKKIKKRESENPKKQLLINSSMPQQNPYPSMLTVGIVHCHEEEQNAETTVLLEMASRSFETVIKGNDISVFSNEKVKPIITGLFDGHNAQMLNFNAAGFDSDAFMELLICDSIQLILDEKIIKV
jgi:hypothetical protein